VQRSLYKKMSDLYWKQLLLDLYTNITTSATPQPDVYNTDCSDGKVISSSVLTYTGNINDDGKILYCTAVNIEGEGVIRSSDTTIVIWCKYGQYKCTLGVKRWKQIN
jgi:hypothetical protein